MRKILIALCLMISISIHARSIDIQCKYDFYRTDDFNQFVKKEVKKHWWNAEFYKEHKKVKGSNLMKRTV